MRKKTTKIVKEVKRSDGICRCLPLHGTNTPFAQFVSCNYLSDGFTLTSRFRFVHFLQLQKAKQTTPSCLQLSSKFGAKLSNVWPWWEGHGWDWYPKVQRSCQKEQTTTTLHFKSKKIQLVIWNSPHIIQFFSESSLYDHLDADHLTYYYLEKMHQVVGVQIRAATKSGIGIICGKKQTLWWYLLIIICGNKLCAWAAKVSVSTLW